jgi:3'-5' exoribonuclease
MDHLFIDQIKAGLPINDVYMVTQPVLRNTTRGDLYIAMFLSDMTGKVNSRMWGVTEEQYNRLPKEGFIRIKGKSELYQNAMQLVVNDFTVVDPDEVKLADFMAKTKKNVAQMFQELKEIVQTVKNDTLKSITDAFLNDKDLMKDFATAPAAMQMHHNYLGGLLEHTMGLLKAAEAIMPLYPNVQRDMVIAGVFLHDIGKTRELSYKIGFSYTDMGRFVGHIVHGVTMIDRKVEAMIADGVKLDPTVVDSLKHVILAHHGQYDFGSPKLPATAEAFMISRLDDLDAKMNQVAAVIENEPGDNDWTSYQRPLETYIYRRRLMD